MKIAYPGDNVAAMSNVTGACAGCHYPGTTVPGAPARVHVGGCTGCHP